MKTAPCSFCNSPDHIWQPNRREFLFVGLVGSIVSHELGSRNNLPPYVCIPTQPNTFAGTGYLGSAFGPFSLGTDPSRGSYKVRDLNLPSGVDEKRFEQRREMRAVVDAHFSA